MTTSEDPIKTRKADLDKNPHGTNVFVAMQHERERKVRYVRANRTTLIFVPEGKNADKLVQKYNERVGYKEK